MALSRQALSDYDATLSRMERAAADYVRRRVDAYMASYPEASVAEVRDFAIGVVDDAVGAYGDAASTAAADLYDELAEASPKTLPTAAVDTSDVSGYVDKEVRYQAGKLVDGAPPAFAEAVAACASDQVSRRANATMAGNVQRDHIRFARVPMGGETCTFCAMLASRGFVYRSAKSAGEGTHWHRNCRCKVVPETAGTVEGYDPDEWYARWKEFERIDAEPGMSGEAKRAARRLLVGDGTEVAAPRVPTPSGSRGPGMLNVRAHARTGGMSPEEFAERRRELDAVQNLPRVRLPSAEYARVVGELNTHLSDSDRKRYVVTKAIGNYRYTFINNGFDSYEFIRRVRLR